jgi:hypothetical protein
MQSLTYTGKCRMEVVLDKLFSSILITQSTPRVRCQCDAVVLVKIVIFCAFLFPFILLQSLATRVRCQCV